ncbi:MAG: hypothetical protein FWD18_05720 [Micrococcales bacterium]|nr:hypothetical protein [Micrococcales bacterium]
MTTTPEPRDEHVPPADSIPADGSTTTETHADPAHTSTLPYPPPTTAPAVPVTSPPSSRGVRLRTVIWGLILATCGAGVIAAALGYRFDMGLAAIALLAAAGVVLLVGSLARAARRRP